MIDAYTLCYQVDDLELHDKIIALGMGEYMEFFDFTLKRIEGRYFQYVYVILFNDLGTIKEFGQLKLKLSNGNTDNHANGKPKAWITIDNQCFYTNEYGYLGHITQSLGLEFNNFTTIDLCKDTPFNISKPLKKLIKNNDTTTILNGKKVRDRDKDRPEITYTTSGSLNKTDKYMTVTVKQKKAIHDKSKGIVVTTYDKLAEITNSSEKQYILDFYGNPNKLYRTEVHLNNQEIKEYISKRNIDLNPYMLDESVLKDMYMWHLNSVIRFEKGNEQINWEFLLGTTEEGL